MNPKEYIDNRTLPIYFPMGYWAIVRNKTQIAKEEYDLGRPVSLSLFVNIALTARAKKSCARK